MYRIIIKKNAFRAIEKLPIEQIESIYNKVMSLSENPRPNGCKKLKGFENVYRIRLGIYRIIYSIFDKKLIVEIIKVAHRKDVYK